MSQSRRHFGRLRHVVHVLATHIPGAESAANLIIGVRHAQTLGSADGRDAHGRNSRFLPRSPKKSRGLDNSRAEFDRSETSTQKSVKAFFFG